MIVIIKNKLLEFEKLKDEVRKEIKDDPYFWRFINQGENLVIEQRFIRRITELGFEKEILKYEKK